MESSVVMQACKDINNSKLLSDYDITSCSQDSGICDLYKNFLSDCNCIDMCDAFTTVREACSENVAVKDEIKNSTYVVLDCPKSDVDVSL